MKSSAWPRYKLESIKAVGMETRVSLIWRPNVTLKAVGCAKAGYVLATCVLIGAAFEAVLLARAMAFEDELKSRERWPSAKGSPEESGDQRN